MRTFLLWLVGVAAVAALLLWIAVSFLGRDAGHSTDEPQTITRGKEQNTEPPKAATARATEPAAEPTQGITTATPDRAATHAAARTRALEKAEERKGFDVRGVRLWMSFEEVQAALAGEIESWEVGPTPGPAEAPYDRRSARAKLSDGATFECEFTSPVSGARLFVFVYEQNLRDGPTPEALLAELQKKYGPPDEAKDTGAYWATYDLQSAAAPIEAYGPLGAFFKIHFRRDENGRVDYVSLVFNDASLGRHDESAVFEARQAAARQEFERSQSGKAKF